MNRVVHFEIHAQDQARAGQFYQNVFGWRLQQWGDQNYWMVTTGPAGETGIDGGLMQSDGSFAGTTVKSYVCTIDVASLDESLSQVTANGGSMVVEKMPVPGVGWLAYCQDTEGNIFGMMQSDPSVSMS